MRDEIVYKCDRCGYTFPLEEGYAQHYEEGDIILCPNCRSYDIEEGERCKICREIYEKDELRIGVCPYCFDDAVSAWKACIEYLQPWEREVLEYEYGNLDVTKKEDE